MPRGTRRTAPAGSPQRRRRPRKASRRRRPPALDPATKYARDVVDGRVVACRFVRQACERHLRDLEDGPGRGLHFDIALAARACAFVRSLKHTKGKSAGGYFNLRPWQEFIVGSIFGWRRRDGCRRFQTAYIEIPRKNGKSELAGALVLYAAFFDHPIEYGAEAYVAATKQTQARIVFKVAQSMLRRAPAHRRLVRVLTHRLVRDDTDSFLEALGADAHTLDGLNPAVVVIDELHAHPTADVVNVMESATGAREQPLQIEITTAGSNQQSICWDHHAHTETVLDTRSGVTDDAWFGIIYTLDERDAWDDPTVWQKANPNLDVSVPTSWIDMRVRRARRIRSMQAEVRQKVMNQWRNVGDRAIAFEQWDLGAEPFDVETLRGRLCYVGLDLARVKDLSAAVAVFPPTDAGEPWYVVPRFWCPEDNIEQRSAEDRVPYAQWAADGLLVATPGNVTDFDWIERDLKEYFLDRFKVQEVAYDETYASPSWVQHLEQAGAKMIPHSQTAKAMMLPTSQFLRLYESDALRHGGHLVLRWCATNMVVRRGQTGDTAPDKKKSRERIDGAVAAIMAVGRACLTPTDAESVYDERGPLLL